MEQLSKKDFTSILINIMYVKLLLAIPRNMVLVAGNAAWILSIYATLIMLLLFFILTKFSRPLTDIKSKPIKISFGIIVTVFLVLSMSSILKIYPDTVKIILLRNTPIEIIFIVIGIAAVLGAMTGVEALGRISSLFHPVAAVIMILCLILLTPHMHLTNLTPILGNGTKNIMIKGITAVSGFSDIILLFILPGSENHIKKIGYKSIIIMGIIMTITLLAYALIFPNNVSRDFVLPFYQMVRLIQVGDFFGRFEAFFEFIWSISILIYFAVYLYALGLVWQKTFDLKYSKPLFAPFIIIISVIVYNSASYTEMNKNYVWYTLTLIAGSVLLPIAAGLIKKYEERKSQK